MSGAVNSAIANSSLSVASENSGVNVSTHVEFSGFVVDIVKQLAHEIPFRFEWLVDTRRTGHRRTGDAAPVCRVLSGVRIDLLLR